MRKIFTAATVFFCIFCSAPSSAEPNATNPEPNQPTYLKPIPPDKLKEDLYFLFKTIEDVHPNMYAYISREEFAKHKDELYKKIDRPFSQIELYKLVAPVIALLRDGHTNVFPCGEIPAHDKFLPLACQWDGINLIISKNFGQTNVPIGGTILTINGEDAGQLIRRLSRYLSSERELCSQSWAAERLNFSLWSENGPVDYYKVQIKLGNGQIKEYDVKTITKTKIEELKKLKEKSEAKADRSYQYFPSYNAGVLAINSFGGTLEEFEGFLKITFKKIQDQNVGCLIIDIRENGGGNSKLGDALLDYLTDKPFRPFEKIEVKLSTQICNLKGHGKKLRREKGEIGSIAHQEIPFVGPQENPLRFQGRKFVFIGTNTFSSATDFASAVKCFNIATLIGQETGGITVSYGDVYNFNLPNSGLFVGVSYKYFVNACGKPDGHGVLPDYEVKQKPEDTAKGVDTSLEFTLNLIKNITPAKDPNEAKK